MNSTASRLTAESLDRITYNRSTIWANLVNRFENVQHEDEMLLDELDDLIAPAPESESSDDIIEEDEEEVLKDITNITPSTGGLSKILIRCTPDLEKSMADNEIQDVLNETRPLLVEHNRKWKEAGLDLILNTFDPQKIEEKVGGWMKRHRSSTNKSARETLMQYVQPPHLPSSTTAKKRVCCADTDSDTDSVDTASYIRSSRQRHSGFSKRVGGSTTKMTIKTYRLVRSKREALHEKYAYLDHADDLLHYDRTRSAPSARYRHVCKSKLAYDRIERFLEPQRTLQRRKLLTRRQHLSRHATSCYSAPSSSEDEACEMTARRGICSKSACSPPHWRMPRKQRGRAYRGQHSMTSSSADNTLECVRRDIQAAWSCAPKLKKKSLITDTRPYRREADCKCYDQAKLCGEIRHLAMDTSAEDWVVENCDTPKKPLTNRKCLPQSNDYKTSKVSKPSAGRVDNVAEVSDETDEDENKNLMQLAIKLKSAGSTEAHKKVHKANELNAKPKTVAKQEVTTQLVKDVAAKKSIGKNKKEKQTVVKKATNNKSKAKDIKHSEEDVLTTGNTLLGDDTFARDLKKAVELSKKEFERQQRRLARKRDQASDDITTFDIQSSTVSTKPPESQASQKSSEDVFFTNPTNIYNSTALPNDTAAGTRQFFSSINTLSTPISTVKKPRSATTHAVSSSSSKVSKPGPASTKGIKRTSPSGDNVVSSTTNEIRNGTPLIASAPELERSRYTNKGILLYTPQDLTLAPEHTYSNGCFKVTAEHLSAVIGEKSAQKFFKHYVGRINFSGNSTVYFVPPAGDCGAPAAGDSSTDSEDDVLESVCNYGYLHESFH